MNKDDEYIYISNQTELENLIQRIKDGKLLANEFKFAESGYFIDLLSSLEIDYDKFTKTYFYFNKEHQLHISESEFGYVWISTYGLIAKSKTTKNSIVNASVNQHTVVSLLLEKAIEISKRKNVYDIDRSSFGMLSDLSPALFHNILFYIEVFCKAYLNLTGNKTPLTHKLSLVYSKLIDTMYSEKHNDSLLHVQIVDKLAKIVEYVIKIPGDFKEQFVKYDDNPEDSTVIIFDPDHLHELKMTFELCDDFILDYYHCGNETHYLKSGFYQRVMNKAENEELKEKIRKMYGHLILNNKNYNFT